MMNDVEIYVQFFPANPDTYAVFVDFENRDEELAIPVLVWGIQLTWQAEPDDEDQKPYAPHTEIAWPIGFVPYSSGGPNKELKTTAFPGLSPVDVLKDEGLFFKGYKVGHRSRTIW